MMRLLLVCAFVAAAGALQIQINADATAIIVPGTNPNIAGTLNFIRKPFGVLITGTVTGLAPGFHGFHVHDVGSTANACAAAGPHFNPLMRNHGSPISLNRHAGDLGNIFADLRGVANVLLKDHKISLVPNDRTFIGNRAIVIHALKDDLGLGLNAESIVTGNAGARDGCGVINRTHGSPKDYNRHAGDLGNIIADEYGTASIHIVDGHISLDAHSPTFIGNRAVVIHAMKDDLGRGGDEGSLTTGNAGGREGCGVIQEAKRDYTTHHNPHQSHQYRSTSYAYNGRRYH